MAFVTETSPTYEELQAENARLTGELDELLTRWLTLAARRDAAQEQVRQYAEAIEGVAAWGCDSPECVNDVCKVVRPIRQLAKNPPDGVSALSELEALKQTIESQASMMDGLREGSRTHAQGEREALSEVAKLRGLLRRLSEWDTMQTAGDGPFWKREIAAALGERSTSPEPQLPTDHPRWKYSTLANGDVRIRNKYDSQLLFEGSKEQALAFERSTSEGEGS